MSNQTEAPKEKSIHFFGLNIESKYTPYLLLGFVALFWVLCWIGVSILYDKAEERGQFGDMFGAVNALFSGLAFAGIIFTILLQREELKAQREELILNRLELALTREELEGQKEEFKKQNETLKQQQFETTFFNLLNQHSKIVGTLSFKPNMHGLETLNHLYSNIPATIKDAPLHNLESRATVYWNEYSAYYNKYIVPLSHYLNSLEVTYSYIYKSPKTYDIYFNILRASISRFEIQILAYYSIFYNANSEQRINISCLVRDLRLLSNHKNLFDRYLIINHDIFHGLETRTENVGSNE